MSPIRQAGHSPALHQKPYIFKYLEAEREGVVRDPSIREERNG